MTIFAARWWFSPAHTAQQIEERAKRPLIDNIVEHVKFEARLKEEVQRTRDTNESMAIATLGGDLKFYRKWNPYQDRNDTIELGTCGEIKCPALTMLEMGGNGPDAFINLRLVAPYFPPFIARLPLRKGCRRELLNAKGYALHVIVENDSIQTLALGVIFARRPARQPMLADSGGFVPPDWTDHMSFVIPSQELICGADRRVCRKVSDTDIEDPNTCLLDDKGVRLPK